MAVVVALTGPPCSGKTSLAVELGARGVHVVPEAALEVIDELNREFDGDLDAQRAWRRANALEFQVRIAGRQADREREALGLPARFVVLDRTSVDGVAYLRRRGLDVPPAVAAGAAAVRPDLVFELALLEEAFDGRAATGRMSTLEDARELAAALREAYLDHGHVPHLLAASLSIEERADVVLDHAQRLDAQRRDGESGDN